MQSASNNIDSCLYKNLGYINTLTVHYIDHLTDSINFVTVGNLYFIGQNLSEISIPMKYKKA
jgi:hypothetical protein